MRAENSTATAQLAAQDWAETRRRLRIDRARVIACYQAAGLPLRGVWCSPSYLCVFLYRCSRLLYVKGHPLLARLVWQLNLVLTGADLSPISELGEGLLVVHPMAVTVCGGAGRGLTLEGQGGLGGGMDLTDIGVGPGLPLLGDDVYVAHGSMVLGPVRIGSGTRIGPGVTIVHDLPPGTEVLAHRILVVGAAADSRQDIRG